MKRALSLILSLLMVLSLFTGLSVGAAEIELSDVGANEGTTGDCTWSFDSDTCILTISGSGRMADYEWVEKTSKTTVPWWNQNTNIHTVVIGDGVTYIGKHAFYKHTKLTQLTLGQNVKEIAMNAFAQCDLSSVLIPNSVETIGDMAFDTNANLKALSLGKNVRTIGDYAFDSCNLGTLKIPDKVESIGSYAFRNNVNLKSLTLGNKVNKIEEYAFSHCDLRELVLPDSVETVYRYAFTNNENLTKATLSNNLKHVAAGLFHKCNLKEVVIPDSVDWIDSWAFYQNKNLTKLTLGKSVKKIGISAFVDCDLKELVIPDSVEELFSSAFNDNKNLTKLTLGKSVKKIGNSAFFKCDLKEVVIPDSVEIIDSGAFGDNKNLTKLTLGKNVKEINLRAFSSCDLKEVVIPDRVEEIGRGAFSGNKSLTVLTLGKSVKKINEDAFYECDLRELVLPDSVEEIGINAFRWNLNLRVITFSENLKAIGKSAFKGCQPEKLVFPDSLETIGDYAFTDNGLGSVTLPEGIRSIGKKALGYAESDGEYYRYAGFTIYGYKGTAAETYAADNNFHFVDRNHMEYRLWLGATQVTDDNKNDILNDGGKAKYDPETNTLTLNEPVVSGYVNYDTACPKFFSVISGLTVKGSYHQSEVDCYIGFLLQQDVRFDGDFTFKGSQAGIYADSRGNIKPFINIDGGSLRAEGNCALRSNGIKIGKDVKRVELISTELEDMQGYAFSARSDDITIDPALAITTPKGGYIKKDYYDYCIFESDGTTIADHVVIEPKPLTTVSCTVTEPVAGRSPSYTATVPAGKGYLVEEDFTDGTWKNGVLWQNETDKKDMTESDTFETGKQYTVTVLLDSAANHSFASNVSGTLNGKDAEVINYGDRSIGVYRTFTCKASVLIGDVNNDGVVNGADAGILNRYTSGWKGYDAKIKNMSAADINGDGTVNGADAGILARHTSGWKQYDKYFES